MKHASLKLQPVGYSVLHAISRLNRSLEECIENFDELISFDIVPAEKLRGYELMLEEVRALVNQDFFEILSDRELHNSSYYEHLRLHQQGQAVESKETFSNQTSKVPLKRRKSQVRTQEKEVRR